MGSMNAFQDDCGHFDHHSNKHRKNDNHIFAYRTFNLYHKQSLTLFWGRNFEGVPKRFLMTNK